MGTRTVSCFLALAAAIALLGLTACSSGGGGGQGPDTGAAGGTSTQGFRSDVTTASPDAPAARAPQPTGPAIAVTWEALARERYLLENSRFRRKGQPQPPQMITLYSESHPEAERARKPRTREERQKYAGSAVVPDADMQRFLQGLSRQGFFRYARDTAAQESLMGSDNARGRITVDRGGSSVTLLSMRGQGLNDNTKAIPKLYSETKQAVMVLRNMTPTLNVTQYGYSGTAR